MQEGTMMTDDERPEDYKELAEWMLADFERYADDQLPHRRYVSIEAYKEDMLRLSSASHQKLR